MLSGEDVDKGSLVIKSRMQWAELPLRQSCTEAM